MLEQDNIEYGGSFRYEEDIITRGREDLQSETQSIFLDLGSSNDWVDLGTEKGGVWSLKLYRTANYNTLIVQAL